MINDWELYKDKDGKVVTITWDQVYAIWRAFAIWREVYFKEKGKYPDITNSANWQKSCLLGRMLIDGKPPLPEAPPVEFGAPAYHLVDPDLCPRCGNKRKGPGRILSVDISQAPIRTITECIEKWHQPRGIKR